MSDDPNHVAAARTALKRKGLGMTKPSQSAKLISRLLADSEMRQNQLADKLGVSEDAVSRWVHGRAKPLGDTLIRIIAATGHEIVRKKQ